MTYYKLLTLERRAQIAAEVRTMEARRVARVAADLPPTTDEEGEAPRLEEVAPPPPWLEMADATVSGVASPPTSRWWRRGSSSVSV